MEGVGSPAAEPEPKVGMRSLQMGRRELRAFGRQTQVLLMFGLEEEDTGECG